MTTKLFDVCWVETVFSTSRLGCRRYGCFSDNCELEALFHSGRATVLPRDGYRPVRSHLHVVVQRSSRPTRLPDSLGSTSLRPPVSGLRSLVEQPPELQQVEVFTSLCLSLDWPKPVPIVLHYLLSCPQHLRPRIGLHFSLSLSLSLYFYFYFFFSLYLYLYLYLSLSLSFSTSTSTSLFLTHSIAFSIYLFNHSQYSQRHMSNETPAAFVCVHA
ncbi:unnamed protein product [Protopolystoma xenopodis]|uniref:Uncharacterized protein n=1 Tax=Protopolystoma xenopodis TaxID=117903 RepID=A0A3S5CJ22_9PLAT|nr:unnamed protein product [Protopolystoma xenopodis]